MTLEARDKMITDLIKENSDATIKDYLEVCKEIAGIEGATDVFSIEMKIINRFTKTNRAYSGYIYEVDVCGKDI